MYYLNNIFIFLTISNFCFCIDIHKDKYSLARDILILIAKYASNTNQDPSDYNPASSFDHEKERVDIQDSSEVYYNRSHGNQDKNSDCINYLANLYISRCFKNTQSDEQSTDDCEFFTKLLNTCNAFEALKSIPDEYLKPKQIEIYKNNYFFPCCLEPYIKKHTFTPIPEANIRDKVRKNINIIKNNTNIDFSVDVESFREPESTEFKIPVNQDQINTIEKLIKANFKKYSYLDNSEGTFKSIKKLDQDQIQELLLLKKVDGCKIKAKFNLYEITKRAVDQTTDPLLLLFKDAESRLTRETNIKTQYRPLIRSPSFP